MMNHKAAKPVSFSKPSTANQPVPLTEGKGVMSEPSEPKASQEVRSRLLKMIVDNEQQRRRHDSAAMGS